MAKRLIPCLNRVLVEKIIPLSKTTAGILLPEKSSKLNSGKVIAVGPGTRDISGNTIPVAVKEGDTVLLPEYGGTEVKLGEKEYHLFRDDDILGTLHEMAAIDWSVCLHNVVFVTTQGGNFQHFLMGTEHICLMNMQRESDPINTRVSIVFQQS